MAEVEVQIDGEQINQRIVDAVLDSVFGEKLKEEVEKSIKGLYSFDGPVKRVIEGIVRAHVADLIHTEYADMIRKKIEEQVNEEAIEKLVDGVELSFRSR